MKSIPSVESDPEEKKAEKKSDEEEVTFDNFGSWVNETRAKNKIRK